MWWKFLSTIAADIVYFCFGIGLIYFGFSLAWMAIFGGSIKITFK